MNRNLQPGTHPDADQLSVFVEGAATAREQERMLAHLAECVQCRKAVFLMQPHEDMQPVDATPARGWNWRRLLPVALPAAALASAALAVFFYIRPHTSPSQQNASIRPTEIQHPEAAAAPATGSRPLATRDIGARSEGPSEPSKDISAQRDQIAEQPNSPESKLRLPNSRVTGSLASNLATADSGQAVVERPTDRKLTARAAASPRRAPAPSNAATGGIGAGSGAGIGGGNGIHGDLVASKPDLPMNGRNVFDLTQIPPPAGAQDTAAQNKSALKKELPGLQMARASKSTTLSGVSGRITDRTGAAISGATITLRDAAGTTRQTTTDTNGSFQLTDVPPGNYELTATAGGFKATQQSIELKPSELARFTPTLNIGNATEQVTVEAQSSAVTAQSELSTTDAQLTTQLTQLPAVSRITPLPSGLLVAATISHGKRVLSLDNAGNLFLSRNSGKKWKKVNPQWTGKALRIELGPANSAEAPPQPQNGVSPAANEAVFQLTTDTGTIWISKDGAHWHLQ